MKLEKKEYLSLSQEQRRRMMFTSFEDFVSEPEPELRRLEKFTGKSRHRKMPEILLRERLPRPHPATEEAAAEINGRISPAIGALLSDCRREYRDYWLGTVLEGRADS